MKNRKRVPKFKNEEEERKFWKRTNSAEYVDWSKAKRVSFPRLKPSVRSISLRLPESMLNDLRTIANKKDVPYQSLLKLFLSEKIKEELR